MTKSFKSFKSFDPIGDILRRYGNDTRESYIAVNFGDAAYELSPEEEQNLPEKYQRETLEMPLASEEIQ